jgi:hypothetical protein
MVVAWSSVACAGFVPYVGFPMPNVSMKAAGPASRNLTRTDRTLDCLQRLRSRPGTGAVHCRLRSSFRRLPLWAKAMIFTRRVFGVDSGFLKTVRCDTSIQCFGFIRVVNAPFWALHTSHSPDVKLSPASCHASSFRPYSNLGSHIAICGFGILGEFCHWHRGERQTEKALKCKTNQRPEAGGLAQEAGAEPIITYWRVNELVFRLNNSDRNLPGY